MMIKLEFYRFTNIFTCYNRIRNITERSSDIGNSMKIRIAKHFGPIQYITVLLTSVFNRPTETKFIAHNQDHVIKKTI